MLFAGFDISSVAVGWSLFDRRGRVVSCGTFKPKGSDVWARLGHFATWFDGFLGKHQPRAVAIEEPLRSDAARTERTSFTDRSGRTVNREKRIPIVPLSTSRALYAFAGVARMICSLRGIPCREVNNRIWRQAFIGVSQAPKGMPQRERTPWLKDRAVQVAKRIGATPDTPDAAEGVGVGFWLYGEIARAAQASRARIAAERQFTRSAA